MTEKEIWLRHKNKELTSKILEELETNINYDTFLHIFEDNYNWFCFLGITEEHYQDLASRVRKEKQDIQNQFQKTKTLTK